MPAQILKNHLDIRRLMSPADFYKKAPAMRRKLPNKIPIGEWINVGAYTQIIVWPYDPIPSAVRGAARTIEFYNYDELRHKYFWKWEYYHDNGDALKIGKKGGLWVYGDDPLLVPGSIISLIYLFIFHTTVADYKKQEKTYAEQPKSCESNLS